MSRKIILAPILGVLVFIILYIIAARLYPGGSSIDKHSSGFSWQHNYWCNLLNEKAINGQYNTAQSFAIAGMFVLGLTLSFFWFIFSKNIPIHKNLKRVIQISGVLSMGVALLLASRLNHDLVINIASLLVAMAIVGTFIGLYKSKWFGLLTFGCFNILLVGLNNYLYYSSSLIIYLPLIQKITFLSFLVWICCISVSLYLKHTEKITL
jgi:hypothetical protein